MALFLMKYICSYLSLENAEIGTKTSFISLFKRRKFYFQTSNNKNHFHALSRPTNAHFPPHTFHLKGDHKTVDSHRLPHIYPSHLDTRGTTSQHFFCGVHVKTLGVCRSIKCLVAKVFVCVN